MADVTIFMKPGCPYCAAAREFYTQHQIPFEEINVKEVAGAMTRVEELTGGKRIVPVIIDHGELKVGFGGG